jgi:endonuclease YncB( thermonuclease family)
LVATALLVVSCSAGDDGAIAGFELPATDLAAVVTAVADGDSFRAETSTGEIEVRLLGINSPELDECHGPTARDALTDLIEGRSVELATEPELDQFDRVLARAIVGGTYVNLEMALNGHSLVVTEGSSDRGALLDAEAQARDEELGLWASDVCGAEGPRPALEITGVDYDPPGADEDESVTIANAGVDRIDLAGFVLRDESSVNRFIFPGIILEPESEIVITTGCSSRDEGIIAWCTDQPVWNNGGDTALVLDPVGRIVAIHRY